VRFQSDQRLRPPERKGSYRYRIFGGTRGALGLRPPCAAGRELARDGGASGDGWAVEPAARMIGAERTTGFRLKRALKNSGGGP